MLSASAGPQPRARTSPLFACCYGRWQTPGPVHTKVPTEGNFAIISVLSDQFQASIEVAMGLWDLPKGSLRDAGCLEDSGSLYPVTWDTSSLSKDIKQACMC